uniref:Uncharacterized protein n=1 Tax=Rhizophora mucronata TaxID=61149 RepID=A0A2P2JUQ2_RHIMU
MAFKEFEEEKGVPTNKKQHPHPTCLVERVQLRLKSSIKDELLAAAVECSSSSSSSISIPTSIFIFSNAWFIFSILLLLLLLPPGVVGSIFA